MATVTTPGPFATKPVEQLLESAEGTRLHRAVGALDLTALGIGAIIGTGIFVIVGEAISESGPALVISFLLAGVTCVFSALAYAELASSIPVSGSAYTYAYATMASCWRGNLPIAIVGSLVIATIIYMLVAVAAVGALPADELAGQDAPLAVALSDGAGIGWAPTSSRSGHSSPSPVWC
jgi:amino acid transporter